MPTVKELREKAKTYCLAGYSKLLKQQLIQLIEAFEVPIPDWPRPDVEELRAKVRCYYRFGLFGYSSIRKLDLIQLIKGPLIDHWAELYNRDVRHYFVRLISAFETLNPNAKEYYYNPPREYHEEQTESDDEFDREMREFVGNFDE